MSNEIIQEPWEARRDKTLRKGVQAAIASGDGGLPECTHQGMEGLERCG